MLNKANRINKTGDLQKVFRLGAAVHTNALVIKFLAGPNRRTAFIVSKKVSKKAVERNRVKRVLRDAMRLNLKKLQSGEYLLVTKNYVASLKNSELRAELEKALNKGKLWQK